MLILEVGRSSQKQNLVPFNANTSRSGLERIVHVRRLETRGLGPEATSSLRPKAPGVNSTSSPGPAHALGAIRGEPPQDAQRFVKAGLDSVNSVSKGATAAAREEAAASHLSKANDSGVASAPAPRCAGAPSPVVICSPSATSTAAPEAAFPVARGSSASSSFDNFSRCSSAASSPSAIYIVSIRSPAAAAASSLRGFSICSSPAAATSTPVRRLPIRSSPAATAPAGGINPGNGHGP